MMVNQLPLSGVSQEQRDKFVCQLRQTYDWLNRTLAYATFCRMDDTGQAQAIGRADAFLQVRVIRSEEKLQIIEALRLLKVKGDRLECQPRISAILKNWENKRGTTN